ncbi:MAG: FtsW/RodA/SpoVE family cell cycle protein [Clostridia bacterium]|nr:FtsW/RodA/SpoVE family cell cycle protein [Clostridia bacterium]
MNVLALKRFFHAIYIYFRRNDNVLLALSLVCAAVGFVLVYSATYSMSGASKMIFVQAVAILLGIVCMIVLSLIDYHVIATFWKYIAIAAVLLLVATLVLGSGRDNVAEKSWIKFAGMSVQPSEIVKIMFIITFAKHIDIVKDKISRPMNVALLLLHAAIPMVLILRQGDYGMTLVFAVIFIGMMFASNLKLRYFAGAGILALIAAPLLWAKLGSRQTGRILALFSPSTFVKQSYQQIQSVSAIGSGEMWGYGLLHGPKTQASVASGLLPEKQNDMIFAVTGEELGFVGCVFIIVLLFALLIKILLTARAAKDMMGSMICVGVFTCFAFQMIANIGMCLFISPVIGLTLPFMSYGGTSVLSSFLGVGLVLSVARKDLNLLFS